MLLPIKLNPLLAVKGVIITSLVEKLVSDDKKEAKEGKTQRTRRRATAKKNADKVA